jgi:hypothetical protein
MNAAVSMLRTVIPAHAGIQGVAARREPRPRGDYRDCAEVWQFPLLP